MSDMWTADVYPTVPPNEKFRQDLQRALEQTHRQQMAQRKLHAAPAEKRPSVAMRLVALFTLLLALLVAWRWLQSRRS